jgi:hypothetical protein
MHKDNRRAGLLLAMISLTVLLNGCSGGGDNSLAGGGIGGTGITVTAVSLGPVSGLGSVIVNGVEFDTQSAEVIVDGENKGRGDLPVTDNLSLGQVVRVEGRIDADESGTAARVVYNDNVKGPVDSVTVLDGSTRRVVVMGQPVIADDRCALQDTDLDAIETGDVLQVSGLVDEAGVITATYVRKISDTLLPGTLVDVKGIVQSPEPLTRSFYLNDLLVDYSAIDPVDLPAGDPQAGQLLQVKGTLSGSTLVASRIELEDELGVDTIETVEIEGFVTDFSTVSDFRLGDQEVRTGAETVFKGTLPEDIGTGSRLVVKGRLKNRIILADTVRDTAKVKMEADVAAVSGNNTLTLLGLDPLVIQINETTKISGSPDLAQEINPGDHTRIFARITAGGKVLAEKILVKAAKNKVVFQGPVAIASEPYLKILGVTVDTTSIPQDGFLDSSGRTMAPDSFFMSAEGNTVSVHGAYQDDAGIVWTEIQLEDVE